MCTQKITSIQFYFDMHQEIINSTSKIWLFNPTHDGEM